MKKTCVAFCLMAALVAALSVLSEGCKGNLAAVPAVVPTPQSTAVISNFNNGTLNMNATLLNGDGGYFLSETYGGAPGHANQIDGSTNPNILVPNPGDGSAYAVHIFGTQTDPLPTSYPAMEVFAFMKNNASNPYYDLTQTPFVGIRFDVKILPYSTAGGVTVGDNNPQKRFAIACAPMVPPTTALGGTCPPSFSTNCYNYFWTAANLPTTNPAVNGGWQPVSFLFSSLKTDGGYGKYQSTGFTASPVFAQQVLFLLWKFGDNGAGGTTNTDFWFDNVQFY
ncbi:MAG TPA: hypothetical protein VK859_04795 [bacterium]|nr:hypothetical protein [bacterium]